MKPKRKVILLVQDGWGIAPKGKGNFIEMAKKPNFDKYIKQYPHCQNLASGNAVGLPQGAQGNSEVGHLHMGAGRIVWQMYEKINIAIKDKSFFENEILIEAFKHAKENNSVLHLMGLCSDEGVHAHTNHLFALLEMAKKFGVNKVLVHFFADGRDVAEKSAGKYAKEIEEEMKKLGVGKFGSIIGRYYSMDRDNNWDRTRKAYDMLTKGEGYKAKDIFSAIREAYARGDKTDYYIQPCVLEGFSPVKDNDSVIFFNFRTDRPRQLTQAFIVPDFAKFSRGVQPKILYTTFSEYDKTFTCPYMFSEDEVRNNFGKVIAASGLKQLRMAETEKYGHVTFFFNSQIEIPNKNEERILIPSAKVASYDLKPEMSAYEIADEAFRQINSDKYDFILINFANCDLVGHSAVKEAIIKCVSVVDECTGKVVDAALKKNYTVVITADHGSAEDKLYPNGTVKPAHSCNPVNFIIVSNDKELQKIKLKNGGQKDVAPTILELMGLAKPKEMTGESLIKK
ncbi:2,3-bisphosphoglycerate-independent phosphoglycerate mutase [uncultured archaeon]|nr:2,3-bisphosphoglycerate-independent phosphoglycerate mutase [uncultured archaeon]